MNPAALDIATLESAVGAAASAALRGAKATATVTGLSVSAAVSVAGGAASASAVAAAVASAVGQPLGRRRSSRALLQATAAAAADVSFALAPDAAAAAALAQRLQSPQALAAVAAALSVPADSVSVSPPTAAATVAVAALLPEGRYFSPASADLGLASALAGGTFASELRALNVSAVVGPAAAGSHPPPPSPQPPPPRPAPPPPRAPLLPPPPPATACSPNPCFRDSVTNATGACSLPTASQAGSGLSFVCSCPPGFTGTGRSCAWADPCAPGSNPCDPLTRCASSRLTPAARANCSACPAGFRGSGLTGCRPVVTCAAGNGGCDPLQSCTDTPGGAVCGACPAGFGRVGEDCFVLDNCEVRLFLSNAPALANHLLASVFAQNPFVH